MKGRVRLGEALVMGSIMVAKCPSCGNRLWQVILDDPAYNADQCPKCGRTFRSGSEVQLESAQKVNRQSLSEHFESMTLPPKEVEVDSWPEEFSEYFPSPDSSLPEGEEPGWVYELNGERPADRTEEELSQDDHDFSDREREEAHRRLFRSHGYGMGVDSQGMRLTNTSTTGNRSASGLSPYEIVRLASELEGGVVPVEERIKCPACEAVILPTDKICQWCSAPLA